MGKEGFMLIEVKWYARGGQGGFTASKLLGLAASIHNDAYAQAFPSFGPERRGAPVYAFTRIDDKPITDHSQLYTFDHAIVLDNTLMDTMDVTDGLKERGMLFINTPKEADAFSFRSDIQVHTFDGTALALEILRAPIINTTMLGVWAAVTGLIGLAALQGAVEQGMNARLQQKNKRVIQIAYEGAKGGK